MYHFVLTVHSLEKTCELYSQILGIEVVTFGQGRKALKFGNSKINLHELGREFEPKADRLTSGSADFGLISTIPL